MSVNYLVEFLYKLDCLISEIDKLNSKIRMYQKNAKNFGFDFDVKFSVSSKKFEELRSFLQHKVEIGSAYDRDIVNLKRDFFKQFDFIMLKIGNEIRRIENVQTLGMNRVVYKAIYVAKWENEIRLKELYDVHSSVFDVFTGVSKFRKLKLKNHELRAELVKKEYNQKRFDRKNVFELVNLIETTDVKNGDILCLQESIIEAFMIDKNSIKKSYENSWRKMELVPSGVFEKRAHYRILNKNLIQENKELQMKLDDNRLGAIVEKNVVKENLIKMNSKIAKVLNSNRFGALNSRI